MGNYVPANYDKLLESSSISSGGSSGPNILKFKDLAPAPDDIAKVTMRILPPRADNQDDNHPYHIERIQYFNVKGKYISGAVDEDPAAELFFKVIGEVKKLKDEALYATVSRLRPQEKYYYNVIDRKDQTVKVISLPPTGQAKIANCLDTINSYDEDATDPEQGRDITLLLKGKVDVGFGNFDYHDANYAPKPTPIGVDGWDEELTDLREFARSYFLDAETIEELIPDLLGDHYERVMKIAQKS